jgi:hypothetical protein
MEVYHASHQQGLKKIVPNKSTHGENWVYATRDIVFAATFIAGLGGNFTFATGRDPETGKPYICERFKGAFDLRYGNAKGSIYVLPGEKFIEGKTSWTEEVICYEEVTPIQEIHIENAKEYLIQLANENKLIIKHYPEKIAGIPEDDEDLVYLAVIWTKQSGERVLEQVKMFHPNLLDRVLHAIKENKDFALEIKQLFGMEKEE